MSVNLRGRNYVSIKDFNTEETLQVLETAAALKLERQRGQAHPLLAGKTLGMIFQKPSLRTRVSFEVGMTQLGGHAIYLAPSDIKLGEREITEDIAKVLSRYCNLIMARVFGHDIVADLAKHAGVPVINGLSDREHPCQILADLQTIKEKRSRLEGLHLVYIGDGNNVCHSLMYGCATVGMNMTAVTPAGYEPLKEIQEDSNRLAMLHGAAVKVSNDVAASVKGADVLYTDVWASMGQESEAAARKKVFSGFQINEHVLKAAHPQCVVLHCLPAHYGDEITYEVARTSNSAIFDQAENRMHSQKALMVLLAG